MMDVITDPSIDEITLMKSVRSGGTQAIIDNAIGYFIDQDPGPMLVVQPGIVEAKNWSKDHLDTMVRDTPSLRQKVQSEKVKDKKNEILHKTFPGGLLYIIGSNSAAGFRQKTIQRAFLDDVDAYDVSASGEGDQIELSRNRTITYMYHHRKIIKVSNPTTRGLSRIEAEFLSSDMRFYYGKCPHCGFSQFLLFSAASQFAHLGRSFLHFDKENLSWAYYPCENCKKPIEEKLKTQMIREGRWIPTRPDVKGHAGFHLSEMISPFSNWLEIARSFTKAQKNRERLRVFINQRLGETFIEDKSTEINEDDLRTRVEDYTLVPEGVIVLTCGVDVQGDRLECVTLGWGRGEHSWLIDRRMIIGSPERGETWRELDAYLETVWMHESGVELKPWSSNGLNAVCIDSSFSTENVYRYVKRRQMRRIYAVKGDEGFKKPFVIRLYHEKRIGARLAILGVDALKLRIYDRLNGVKTRDGEVEIIPPGYMHFNRQADADFFDQLTAEKLTTVRTKQGYPTRKWILKESRRNEMLDCYVYNLAAYTLLNPNMEKLAEILVDRIDAAKQRGPVEETQEEESKPNAATIRRHLMRQKKSWLNNY